LDFDYLKWLKIVIKRMLFLPPMIFRRVGDSSADYYVQCRTFRLKKAGRWKRFLNCSAVHGN
jgi:hypothetical protein